MSKTITVNGKRYTVPDEATMEQIAELVASDQKPLHGPELAAQREAQALDARRAEQTKPKPAPVAPAAPPRTLIDDAISVANATGDALAPYGVAAGAGGGAGALVGGVGAPFGALAGVTGLALGDVAAGGYNLVAPMFGGQPMTAPSEAIRQQFRNVGLTKPAEDPMGRVVFNALNTGAASIGGGNMMRMGGELLKKAPGILGATGQVLATPVANSMAASAGAAGGAASQTAKEMGAPNWLADTFGLVASIPGGMAGGKMAGIKPTDVVPVPGVQTIRAPVAPPPKTAAAITGKVNEAYKEAHAQGVEIAADDAGRIFKRALADAVDPKHPEGPIASAGAIYPPLRAVITKYTDLADELGRLDSRNLEKMRKELGEVIKGGKDEDRIIATRVRESIDAQTSTPGPTINRMRSDVAAARTASDAEQAKAREALARAGKAETALEEATAAWKADPSPANAAARAAAITEQSAASKLADEADGAAAAAAEKYAAYQKFMHSNDPDIKGVASRAKEAEAEKDKAYDAYRTAADEFMTLESELPGLAANLKKQQARHPDAHVNVRTAASELRKAEAAVKTADAKVAQLVQQSDEAAAKHAKVVGALNDREKLLATVDDAKQRVDTRNAALAQGREMTPAKLNTAKFEAMPDKAETSAAGAAGDAAAALRQQVRAFVTQQKKTGGFSRLPQVTQDALNRFAAGGGVTQHLLEGLGSLSPGGGSRHGWGNAFSVAAAIPAFFATGMNPVGALAGPALSTAVTTAARAKANDIAKNEFARLRDLVSQGTAARPKPPGNATNKIFNYMLADQLTADPKR